jgi:hypothetical protein
MGSVFKGVTGTNENKSVSTPSSPATYINEISGYEQVPVKNADGSITYITRELELSDEEKQQKAELEKIANDALSEIKTLSSSDYTASESVQNLLNDWQENQLTNLNESFDNRKELESDTLAKRGLSDSTAASTVSRQTKQDEYDANKEVSNEKSAIAENLRQTELNNQQNLYSLAQNQVNYDAAQLQNSTKGDLSAINAMNATNAASINDYYNSKLQNQNQNNAFLTSVLDPLASSASSSSSNTLSSGISGFVSTITGGFM